MYDVASVPVVFRDLDFVVVRPEAVRAVVEIKGRLSKTGLSSILENAATFAEKWKVWADSHAGDVLQVPRPKDPEIAALAWKVNGAPGRPTPNGTEAREAIAARFGPMFDGRAATSPPLFDHLFVYDEYIVGQSVDVFDDGRPGSSLKVLFGWKTTHGRWLKRGDNGLSSRREDKTIATLLAAVLGALEDPKLSGLPTGKYMGTPWRPRDDDVQPHPCSGTTHCGELKPPTPRQGEATSKLKKPRQRTS